MHRRIDSVLGFRYLLATKLVQSRLFPADFHLKYMYLNVENHELVQCFESTTILEHEIERLPVGIA